MEHTHTDNRSIEVDDDVCVITSPVALLILAFEDDCPASKIKVFLSYFFKTKQRHVSDMPFAANCDLPASAFFI